MCSLRDPSELVGLWVPLGLGGYGGAAKDGWTTVIEGDGIVGKPGAKGFASTGGDGLGEATFELQQQEGARREGWLGERVGFGAGKLRKCVEARRGDGAVLRSHRQNRDGAENKADKGGAKHVEYATSRKIGLLRVAFGYKADILRT